MPNSVFRVCRFRSAIAGALLACCLAPGLPGVVYARTAAADAPSPSGLTIAIIAGEGDLNDVRARTAREPIVEVRDRNHKPVAGALVLFAVHGSGSQAVASFSGVQTLTVRTGLDGRAVGQGFEVTHHTGTVTIDVTATLGALVTEAVIHQTNYAHGNRLVRLVSQHKLVSGAIAGLGVAIIVSAVVAVDTETHGVSITPGTGTVAQAQPRR